MIQPINNISFKSFWQKPGKYSIGQNRTILEIQGKLNYRTLKDDYMVEPGENDTVLLYKFDNLKKLDGIKLSYDKRNLIGFYSQEKPFYINDLNEVEEIDDKEIKVKEMNNLTKLLLYISVGFLALILPTLFSNKSASKAEQVKIEQVVKPITDSLRTVKQDSVKLLK